MQGKADQEASKVAEVALGTGMEAGEEAVVVETKT